MRFKISRGRSVRHVPGRSTARAIHGAISELCFAHPPQYLSLHEPACELASPVGFCNWMKASALAIFAAFSPVPNAEDVLQHPQSARTQLHACCRPALTMPMKCRQHLCARGHPLGGGRRPGVASGRQPRPAECGHDLRPVQRLLPLLCGRYGPLAACVAIEHNLRHTNVRNRKQDRMDASWQHFNALHANQQS